MSLAFSYPFSYISHILSLMLYIDNENYPLTSNFTSFLWANLFILNVSLPFQYLVYIVIEESSATDYAVSPQILTTFL